MIELIDHLRCVWAMVKHPEQGAKTFVLKVPVVGQYMSVTPSRRVVSMERNP